MSQAKVFLMSTAYETLGTTWTSRADPKPPSRPWHPPGEYKMFASHAISTAFPFFVRRRDKNIVSQSCLDILIYLHVVFKCPSRSQSKNYCILTCQPTPTRPSSVALLARWRSNIKLFNFSAPYTRGVSRFLLPFGEGSRVRKT